MNRLDVRTTIWQGEDAPHPFRIDVLLTEIKVDGTLLVDYRQHWLATDIGELARTLQEDGDGFFIVTCTCGDARCAGIRQGMRVYRDSKNVHWVLRDPPPTQVFAFEQEAYQAAIARGLKQTRQMVERYPDLDTVPPHNKRRLLGKK